MTALVEGRVWRFEDDIDTDQIIPSQYLVLASIDEMAQRCLEPRDTTFARSVRPNDIVVAGRNFGCGSSREQAVLVLKALKIGAVVAKSFSRIFFRNAVNNGLPVIMTPHADLLAAGERIGIDVMAGVIHLDGRSDVNFAPLTGLPLEIFRAGGLIPYLKQKTAA